MDCVLFRHGLAVERTEWSGRDADRPLTDKGRTRTRQAASGLMRLDLAPLHLLSSPFVRAHDTAKLLHEAFRLKGEIRLCDELLPGAAPDKLFPLLESFPADACVICVGHEPHLSETAGVMLFGEPAACLSLKKAGACLIHFDGIPKPGRGHLQWWLGPGLLRALRKA